MRVLMIYIEPAPYILDLIRVMRQQHPELQLRVLFISASTSQPWGSRLNDGVSTLLPEGKVAALKQIASEIRKGDFDWLHLAGWGHPLLMSALLVGAAFRHHISLESDTQLPVGQDGWKKWIKEIIYPRLFSLVDVFFPGGTRQRQYFSHYGVPEKKITIAQMTVDVTAIMKDVQSVRHRRNFIKQSWGLPEVGLIFLYVGRLDHFKGGVDDLLNTFGELSQKRERIYLVIAGDGDLRGRVEMASSSLDSIIYLGRIDTQQVRELYTVGDVLVLPSHFDNWGLVINEGMAAGLPVIVSDHVGCVDDLVKDGQTGLVFPSHDSNALLTSMLQLVEDDQLRERMGLEGKSLISHWRLEEEVDIISKAWYLGVRDG